MPKLLFTSETGKFFAARSHGPDSKRLANFVPKSAMIKPVKPAEPIGNDADEYIQRRIKRVRKQIQKIDTMILDELDPTKLDRLASAATRLAEVERVLSGRALPGSLKPRSGRPDRNQPNLAPRAATPQPIDNSMPSTVQEPVPDPLPVHLYHMT